MNLSANLEGKCTGFKPPLIFFQYTNVAAPDVFEWGYRRGNDPQHFREEYLSQKAHNFKAKLRWGDAYEVY